MPKVAPGLRRYIASALAAAGTASAETAAVAVLLDKDAGVVEAAVRSLIAGVPNLTPAHRQALVEQLLQLVHNKKEPLGATAAPAVLRLLAALDDPRVEQVLWERIVSPYPPEVRAAALQALGKWIATPGKEQLKRLFACAVDADFRLAAPALVLLKDLPVGERAAAEWLTLLQAADVAVRRLAMDKVGDRDTAEVADALLQQIDHPDRSLRDGALARLTQLKQGQKALTTALLEAESSEKAWLLARCRRRSPANIRRNGANRCLRGPSRIWRRTTAAPTPCCFCCARPTPPSCAIALNSGPSTGARKKHTRRRFCTYGSSSAIRRAVSRSVWSWLCAA